MAESTLLKAVLKLEIPGCKLYRNQVGIARLRSGRMARTGLGTGSSDLIGYRTITIGGKRIAQFVAIELKDPDEKGVLSDGQLQFGDGVFKAGGIWGVAWTVEQVVGILTQK